MGNNPKLGLVNVDKYTKFNPILSNHSQDNEHKEMTKGRNYRITEGQNYGRTG